MSEKVLTWAAVFCQKAFLRRVRFWFIMRWLQLSNVFFGLALIHDIKASRRLRGGFAECRVACAENNFPTGAYAEASRTYYGLEGNLPEPSRWKCIQKKNGAHTTSHLAVATCRWVISLVCRGNGWKHFCSLDLLQPLWSMQPTLYPTCYKHEGKKRPARNVIPTPNATLLLDAQRTPSEQCIFWLSSSKQRLQKLEHLRLSCRAFFPAKRKTLSSQGNRLFKCLGVQRLFGE